MSIGRVLRPAGGVLRRAAWLALLAALLAQSTVPLRDPVERLRRYTRAREFDFLGWTLDALGVKAVQASLGVSAYLSDADRPALVRGYFDRVAQAEEIQARLTEIYADPAQPDPGRLAAPLDAQLASVRRELDRLQPTVETILQEQAAAVLTDIGLGAGGAAFPPVSFHFSQLPLALIVSPRRVIRQDADIQLDPAMSLDRQVALESAVEASQDVSALVVPVGGIGTYPTMVQENTALAWTAEVVVHEWVHNYLTLRPLGLSYEASPELRTMNETTASILGKAIGAQLLERYYPDLAPPPESQAASPLTGQAAAPTFDFRAEMRRTRLTVDTLLAEGQVAEAEAYMRARRQVFWDHGYRSIRRLNQAYFAFYGAYADEPGGAAGEDPVGAAVRQLWARNPDPAAFLRRMAWMSSYAALQAAVKG